MPADVAAPQMSPLSDHGDDRPMLQTNNDFELWFSIPDPPLPEDPSKTMCSLLSSAGHEQDAPDKYPKMAVSMDMSPADITRMDFPVRTQMLSSCTPRNSQQSDNLVMEVVSPAPPMQTLIVDNHDDSNLLSSFNFLSDPPVPHSVEPVEPTVELFGSVGEILDVNNQSMAFQDEECYADIPSESAPAVDIAIANPIISADQQQRQNQVTDHEAIADAVEGCSAPTQDSHDLTVPKSQESMTPSQLCHNILQKNVLRPTSPKLLPHPLVHHHPPSPPGNTTLQRAPPKVPRHILPTIPYQFSFRSRGRL